jgi:hypothetical protein
VDGTESGLWLKLQIGTSFLLVLPVHGDDMPVSVLVYAISPGEVSMDFHLVVSGGGEKDTSLGVRGY